MAPGSRQPKWDIYEAIILLHGYLETLQSSTPRLRIIKRISSDLRKMAINRGMEIDDIFRNEKGISYQIKSMESAYKGQVVCVPSTKLFDEAVSIFINNREKYLDLLEGAKNMVESKHNNRDAFLAWAEANLPAPKYKWIEENILKMEQLAISSELISGSIFDVVELTMLKTIYKASTKNKIFQIKNRKIIKNISDDFRTYMQYCSQLLEQVDQMGKSDEPIPDYTLTACESEFYHHLKNIVKLAEKTCVSYVSSIRSAEQYAAENRYTSCELFCDVREKTIATATELYHDSCFIRYNEQQHNKFSTAINILLESIGAPIPENEVSSPCRDKERTVDSKGVNTEIVEVLKQHYEYGFKFDSIRELLRFRQFADAMGIALPENDEALTAAILYSGTIVDDKVYFKNDNMTQELQCIVDDIFSSGVNVIYYESLFEKEKEWTESHVIISPDMLKEYLQKNISGCSFSKRFMVKGCRRSEKEAVTDEIKRVWGTNQSNSVYDLHDCLPYIPLGNIWRIISGNDHFALVSEGEYLFVDRFRITKDEENDILEFVERSCEENGFASLYGVPLGGIEEENYELTQIAIYNAIYKKVLSHKYQLNGKILSKGKTELDAITLLKQYIKNKDECTFDEVAEKVVELTGSSNRQYVFQALYDDMVRVDRNRFVSNRYVRFPVDEIDTVLSGFITDKFRAIRDVTTFAMFPLCGQNWNHYLLESFSYKYSRKYSLRVIHFNDKNAGIIAEKDFNRKYNELVAIALARTNVELSPKISGQYLFKKGYMAKSKYTKLDEIIQQALKLRNER